MPTKRYLVTLTPEERANLLKSIKQGEASARRLNRARILLKADEGLGDEQIAGALNTSSATAGRIRQRFVEEGLEGALDGHAYPGRQPKLSGKEEAHLIALACSDAPDGRVSWTLRLLADKAVELGLAESLSHETVRQVLKRGHSNPT